MPIAIIQQINRTNLSLNQQEKNFLLDMWKKGQVNNIQRSFRILIITSVNCKPKEFFKYSKSNVSDNNEQQFKWIFYLFSQLVRKLEDAFADCRKKIL